MHGGLAVFSRCNEAGWSTKTAVAARRGDKSIFTRSLVTVSFNCAPARWNPEIASAVFNFDYLSCRGLGVVFRSRSNENLRNVPIVHQNG